MILDPSDLTPRERYKIAIGSILPRPIAWVSSMDAAGNLNLAPFSYFTVASSDPLTLIFCPQAKGSDQQKDTLNNIRAVPEFVVNITNEDTAEAMNQTATLLPPGESEFAYAGLTPAPGRSVRVPRVAEAPLAYECWLHQIVTVGGGSAVFGTVQSIYIRDDVYVDGYIVLEKLKPIGRLAGDNYTRVTDIFELIRDRKPR